MPLNTSQKTILLTLAQESIIQGLKTGKPLKVHLDAYPPALTEPRATFVTLEYRQELRGSFGGLEATHPLVEDVATNAFAAAFCDRRFLPLAENEIGDVELHIAILSPVEKMIFDSESDLLAQLRPNIDGLILKEGLHQAHFLPSAWDALIDPMYFLQELKLTAGLPASYWSDTLMAYRYTTENIGY